MSLQPQQQQSGQPKAEVHTDTHDGKPKLETHTNPKLETKDPQSNINANPNAGRPNEPAATYTGSGGASTTVSPPTNAPSSVPGDLADALEKSKSTLQQQQTNPHIDDTGRLLASGAEKVLSTTQDFLVTSGNDQRIQAFVQHLNAVGQKVSARANPQAAAQAAKPGEGEKSEVKENFQQLGSQLPQLVRDLVMSSELRQLLVELIDTFDKLSSAFFSKVDVKSKLKSAILQSDSGEGHGESQAQGALQQAKEHGQRLQEEANQGVQHAADQMTDEEKENLIRSFRSVLAKVGHQPSYKQSADSFMALYDLFRRRGGSAAAAGGAQDPELQTELAGLYGEATAILRDLIQQKDLTPLEDKSRQFYRYLDEHHDVGQYFAELRAWAKDLIDRPDAQDDRQVLDEGKRFINRGNEIFRDEQVQQLQRDISAELRDILRRVQDDSRTQTIKSGVAEMSQAFAGSPLQAIAQTRLLAIPILKEFLKEIPLPRIDGTADNGATYTLDNMVLRGRELSLDDVCVNFKFGLNDLITLVFKIRNVEGRISNVDFAYHSKGMFSWSDEGRLSCFVSSPGWKLKWVVRETPNQPLQFQLAETSAAIRKFKIDIEQARHKMLDKMVTSLFAGVIRKRIETQAEQSLQKQGAQITEKVNQSFAQLQNKISSAASQPGSEGKSSSSGGGLLGGLFGGSSSSSSSSSSGTSKQAAGQEQHKSHGGGGGGYEHQGGHAGQEHHKSHGGGHEHQEHQGGHAAQEHHKAHGGGGGGGGVGHEHQGGHAGQEQHGGQDQHKSHGGGGLEHQGGRAGHEQQGGGQDQHKSHGGGQEHHTSHAGGHEQHAGGVEHQGAHAGKEHHAAEGAHDQAAHGGTHATQASGIATQVPAVPGSQPLPLGALVGGVPAGAVGHAGGHVDGAAGHVEARDVGAAGHAGGDVGVAGHVGGQAGGGGATAAAAQHHDAVSVFSPSTVAKSSHGAI